MTYNCSLMTPMVIVKRRFVCSFKENNKIVDFDVNIIEISFDFLTIFLIDTKSFTIFLHLSIYH